MKIRKGFVSNSSSSSFVVEKKHLTDEQIEKIVHHIEHGIKGGFTKSLEECYDKYFKRMVDDGKMGEEEAKKKAEEYVRYDEWNVVEYTDVILGNTTMDNFDMNGFMKKIGVPMGKVEWRD